MPVTVIGGEQRGDEGKGRFVDLLAEDHHIVARFNGGPNAGHTVVLPNGVELDLHGLPSGVAHPGVMNIIGNGVLLDPIKLDDEINGVREKGIEVNRDNLQISSSAHLILPHHIAGDERREQGKGRQGSTKSGIAQAASDKYMRTGVRAELINNDPDGLFEVAYENLRAQQRWMGRIAGIGSREDRERAKEFVERALELGEFITDTALELNRALARGEYILAEGAQAFLLDIDQGMYPYTTSSSPSPGGVAAGLGVPPTAIQRIIGVSKAVPSHVGDGPFPTEIHDPELLAQLHGNLAAVDAERGTTTGRTRRLGYLDLPVIRRAQLVSGTGEGAITKLDWMPRYGSTLKICTAYERKGNELRVAPDAAYKLEQSTPIYETLPNWEEDIQEIRKFEDLPLAAQHLVRFIEAHTGTPITFIGVGPRRDQYIRRAGHEADRADAIDS